MFADWVMVVTRSSDKRFASGICFARSTERSDGRIRNGRNDDAPADGIVSGGYAAIGRVF